jgi:uncharacterized protein DUF4396
MTRLVISGPAACPRSLRAHRPGVASASDTVSITTMEIIDNAFILIVPGAMAAGLGDALFWWSLASAS